VVQRRDFLPEIPQTGNLPINLTPLGGNVTSAGWQVTLCVIPCGMRVPVALWQPCELLYTCYVLVTYSSCASDSPQTPTSVRVCKLYLLLANKSFNFCRLPLLKSVLAAGTQCVYNNCGRVRGRRATPLVTSRRRHVSMISSSHTSSQQFTSFTTTTAID